MFHGASCRLTTKLSDPAHEGVRLQPGRDGRVRCSAWLGGVGLYHFFPRFSTANPDWSPKGDADTKSQPPAMALLIYLSNSPASSFPLMLPRTTLYSQTVLPLGVAAAIENTMAAPSK